MFERVGECDWCHADAIPLTVFNDMEVCKGCHQELIDRHNPVLKSLQEQYKELINILNRSGG